MMAGYASMFWEDFTVRANWKATLSGPAPMVRTEFVQSNSGAWEGTYPRRWPQPRGASGGGVFLVNEVSGELEWVAIFSSVDQDVHLTIGDWAIMDRDFDLRFQRLPQAAREVLR